VTEHSVHQRYAPWIKAAQAARDTQRVRELTAQRDADVRSELQRLDTSALQPLPLPAKRPGASLEPLPLAPYRTALPAPSSGEPWASFSPR